MLTPLQELRAEVMAGGAVWRRHWRAQDRRTRRAVRAAAYLGRPVSDPDLWALVVGYAVRQGAPLWPVAFVLVVVALSLAALTVGPALGWGVQAVRWVVAGCLLAFPFGAVALAVTQRGVARTLARHRPPAEVERPAT